MNDVRIAVGNLDDFDVVINVRLPPSGPSFIGLFLLLLLIVVIVVVAANLVSGKLLFGRTLILVWILTVTGC